jgi:hypothetical protein
MLGEIQPERKKVTTKIELRVGDTIKLSHRSLDILNIFPFGYYEVCRPGDVFNTMMINQFEIDNMLKKGAKVERLINKKIAQVFPKVQNA